MKNLDKIPTCKPAPEATTEPAIEPTKHNKSKVKLQQEFMNEIIAGKKVISYEIFWKYFKYKNPSILAKDLIRANQVKNE